MDNYESLHKTVPTSRTVKITNISQVYRIVLNPQYTATVISFGNVS